MPILELGQITQFEIKESSFFVGTDSFSDLVIQETPNIESFYYFFDEKRHKLIKQFVLLEKIKVRYVVIVTLIKKASKFEPRLEFSIRDKSGKIIKENIKIDSNTDFKDIKSRISMEECHENFWELISYLQSLRDIDTPNKHFSLLSQDEDQIIEALRDRDKISIKNLIKQLSSIDGVNLSNEDISQVLRRKEKLIEFTNALIDKSDNENWWQLFFEENKWIFGYGLNYHILNNEQSQPHYGGDTVDGKGGQKGDYLTSTIGGLRFTVLVEIKTPKTLLLQGLKEIRNGAWSLSKDLTDAISQIQANIQTWDKEGSEENDNRDRFEKENIFTVKPKGIIVIGSLKEFENNRHKRETFQRFRRSIFGIDILTFDELYERAKFIVSEKFESKE